MNEQTFYWFYAITPQVFAALIAALGMVAVYKLTMLNEDIKLYCKSYSVDSGFQYSLTLEKSLEHCIDRIRGYEKNKHLAAPFVKQRYIMLQYKNVRQKIIRYLVIPSLICFLLIVASYFLLLSLYFNQNLLSKFFYIVLSASVLIGWGFYGIILLPLGIKDRNFQDPEIIKIVDKLRK